MLRERIHIDGMPLHVADTAGLRDEADVVEAEGIRRARQEMTRADRILYVDRRDPHASMTNAIERELATLPADVPVTLVINKIDLLANRVALRAVAAAAHVPVRDDRRRHRSAARASEGVHGISGRGRRHDLRAPPASRRARARRSHICTKRERQLLEQRAGELMAEELRQAQQALAEITGEFTSDDLLGRIFASFCIGK